MPSVNLLRGVAIAMVVLFHAYGGLDWVRIAGSRRALLLHACVGELNFGVQLFFLLSGFLITGILLRDKASDFYYSAFYIKRMARILPVYLVVICVLKIWMPVQWRFVVASVLFMANFSSLFGAPLSQYGSLWSLAVEEHFYILWPTFVRRCSERTLLRVLLALIVVEPILRVIAINIDSRIDTRFKTIFVLDYIAYGAFIALLAHTGRLTTTSAKPIALGLLTVSIPLVALSIWLTAFHDSVTLVALRPVFFMWLSVALLLFGVERDSRMANSIRAAERGVLPLLAYVSYGLYLINVFVNAKVEPLVRNRLVGQERNTLVGVTIQTVVSLVVAVGAAYLSLRYFEDRMINLGKRMISRLAVNRASV